MGKNYKKKTYEPKTRINERIRAPKLRVIDAEGEMLGVLPTKEALVLAKEAGVDLIEVSPNADPPVAKILDWGKYNYQLTKKAQQAKKNQKAKDMKQIRFGLKIGENDLDIKLKKVREFLEDGHKVKISAFFRGRELAHPDIGRQLLNKVLEKLEDIATVEQEPTMAGKLLSMTVKRNK